jgi:hypothetical protein
MDKPRKRKTQGPKPHVIPELHASGTFTDKFAGLQTPEALSAFQSAALALEKREGDKREAALKAHNDRALIRITGFGVLVTFIVGFAGFWAAFEAHKARIEAHGMGDASYKLQHDALARDERPFVAVDVVKDTVPTAKYASQTNLLYVNIVSTGKSPAIHVHGECEAFHQSMKNRPNYVSTGKDFENTYLLPSRDFSIVCPYVQTGSESFGPLDPFTIMGYVKYTDTESKDSEKYATPFCYDVGLLKGKYQIIPCFTENKGLPLLK